MCFQRKGKKSSLFGRKTTPFGKILDIFFGVGFSQHISYPVANTYFESVFQIRNCYYTSSEKQNDEMIDLEFVGYCIAYVSVAVISILFVIAYVRDRRKRKNPRKAKE